MTYEWHYDVPADPISSGRLSGLLRYCGLGQMCDAVPYRFRSSTLDFEAVVSSLGLHYGIRWTERTSGRAAAGSSLDRFSDAGPVEDGF